MVLSGGGCDLIVVHLQGRRLIGRYSLVRLKGKGLYAPYDAKVIGDYTGLTLPLR